MTNRFSADKVQKIVNNHLMEADQKVAEIKAMLSPPKRPTLADMGEKERVASQWMQADVPDLGERHVIAVPCDDSDDMVGLISADELASVNGGIRWMHPENVTPRPDLPRLEWPGDTKVEDVPALPEGWRLADHRKYGRVIVTKTTPDPSGHVYFVMTSPENTMGYDWFFCDPDELTYLDQEAGIPDAVPPNTLTVGSQWNSGYALAQACVKSGYDRIVVSNQGGYVFAWSKKVGGWEGTAPPHFAPFTVVHTEKKADQ